jgi:hypothetical protein
MARYVVTNVAEGHWVESLDVRPSDLGITPAPKTAWSVEKRLLHGGRREGTETIVLDNGALAVTVVPTRGMGLWTARLGGDRIGWRSPVTDGPVNPAFVELTGRSGLGWLHGFDELMVRCGLESNGPPVFDSAGRLTQTLHGRIANIPAHTVAVSVEDEAPHTLSVEGEVDETELFFSQLHLSTRVSTVPGSNRLMVRDEITNRHDTDASFELLYHWNFGPPHLDEGARFVAPVKTVCPITPRAAEGIGHYDVFGPPQAGFAEQVYLFTLHADAGGKTLVLLRNRAADKGVVLRFDVNQLPCFTLWKSTQGLREGYVTGLEPGVNYPNARPFEQSHGRVRTLPPGGSHLAETVLEALAGAAQVEAARKEIQALQESGGAPVVHPQPVAPFAAVG